MNAVLLVESMCFDSVSRNMLKVVNRGDLMDCYTIY